MAPSLEEIMQGIEGRLATIAGLRVNDIVPGQVQPPFAFVGCPPVETYHQTMGRGKFQLLPTITVLTSATWGRTGQLALARYANPTGDYSIPTAINGDKTLGGVVDDTFVMGFRPLGMEEVGAIGYYGGVFDLRVTATGN